MKMPIFDIIPEEEPQPVREPSYGIYITGTSNYIYDCTFTTGNTVYITGYYNATTA